MPTPAGVPIEIIVPAFSTITLDSSLITCGISKIKRSVLLCCPQNPVDLALDGKHRRSFYHIFCNDKRPHWSKTIHTFSKVPLFMSGLNIPCTDIINHRIAKHIVESLFSTHMRSIFANDDSQFCFIVQAVYQTRIGWNAPSVRGSLIYPFGKVYRIGPCPFQKLLFYSGLILFHGL